MLVILSKENENSHIYRRALILCFHRKSRPIRYRNPAFQKKKKKKNTSYIFHSKSSTNKKPSNRIFRGIRKKKDTYRSCRRTLHYDDSEPVACLIESWPLRQVSSSSSSVLNRCTQHGYTRNAGEKTKESRSLGCSLVDLRKEEYSCWAAAAAAIQMR